MDSSLKAAPGSEVCYELFGEQGIGKMMGQAIITPEGEALEGMVLNEMSVCGIVVAQVIKACDDRQPLLLLNTNNGVLIGSPVRPAR